MEYEKAYYFLFNQLTDLMQAFPALEDVIIRIQQQAEDIIIDGEPQ